VKEVGEIIKSLKGRTTLLKILLLSFLLSSILLTPLFLLKNPNVAGYAEDEEIYIEDLGYCWHLHNYFDDYYIHKGGFQISNSLTERWATTVVGLNYTFNGENFSKWTTQLSFTWRAFNRTGFSTLVGKHVLYERGNKHVTLYLNYHLRWNDTHVRLRPILNASIGAAKVENVIITYRMEDITISGDSDNDFVAIPKGNGTNYFLPADFSYVCQMVSDYVENETAIRLFDNSTWKFVEFAWNKNFTYNLVSYPLKSATVRGIGDEGGTNGAVQMEFEYPGKLTGDAIFWHSFFWHDPTEVRYFRNAITESKVYVEDYNIVTGSLSSGSVSNLTASDNVYMVFSSTEVGVGDYQIEVEFNGTHTGAQPKLELKAEGKYSGAVTSQYNSFYNYDLSRYAQSGEDGYDIFEFGTVDTVRYLNVEFNFTRFVDSVDGEWRYNITCLRSSAFTFSLDYVHLRTFGYELGTSQTASAKESAEVTLDIGIRVWYFNSSDHKEIEVTSGSPVATVTVPTSTTTKSNTWNCPETTGVENVTVRIYHGTTLLYTFVTEGLEGQLDAYTWTVYYAFLYKNIGTPRFPNWITTFVFGSATYNSRIEDFKWSVGAVSYELNLCVKDWDVADAMEDATVCMNNGSDNIKSSDSNGWANYTGVSGSVTVNVTYYSFLVNSTSFSVSSDTTENLQCKLYDTTITVNITSVSAYLYSANVTAYNGTSISANQIKSGVTSSNGQTTLTNLPNNTLTLTIYGNSSYDLVIGNTTKLISSDGQSFTVTADQNSASVPNDYGIVVWVVFLFPLERELLKRRFSEKDKLKGRDVKRKEREC